MSIDASNKNNRKKKIILLAVVVVLGVAITVWNMRRTPEPPIGESQGRYMSDAEMAVLMNKDGGFYDASADTSSKEEKLEQADEPSAASTARVRTEFLNLFFSDQYLNIQASNIEREEFAIMPQIKAGFLVESDPPQNVQIRDLHNGKAVILIWNEFIAPPDSIKIFRTTSSGVQGQEIAQVSGSSKGYYDYGVVIGNSYYYSLISVGINGDESAVTGPYQIGPVKDLVPPEKPKYARFEVIDSGISITWFDPPDDDLKFINIYRSPESGKLGERITQVMAGTGEFVDESIEADNKYYYLLTSVDESDNESLINVGVTDDELGDLNPMEPF